jgi:hypothetical protein
LSSIEIIRVLARALRMTGVAALLTAIVALPVTGMAQSDPALVTALAECRALGNDRMRLACFDDVAVRVGGVSEPMNNSDEVNAAAASTVAVTDDGERHLEDASDDAADEIVAVTIVDVRTDSLRRTSLVTDDGKVFVQTDSRTRSFPATPFAAGVRSGALGSSFLVIPGGRDIRVTLRD